MIIGCLDPYVQRPGYAYADFLPNALCAVSEMCSAEARVLRSEDDRGGVARA